MIHSIEALNSLLGFKKTGASPKASPHPKGERCSARYCCDSAPERLAVLKGPASPTDNSAQQGKHTKKYWKAKKKNYWLALPKGCTAFQMVCAWANFRIAGMGWSYFFAPKHIIAEMAAEELGITYFTALKHLGAWRKNGTPDDCQKYIKVDSSILKKNISVQAKLILAVINRLSGKGLCKLKALPFIRTWRPLWYIASHAGISPSSATYHFRRYLRDEQEVLTERKRKGKRWIYRKMICRMSQYQTYLAAMTRISALWKVNRSFFELEQINPSNEAILTQFLSLARERSDDASLEIVRLYGSFGPMPFLNAIRRYPAKSLSTNKEVPTPEKKEELSRSSYTKKEFLKDQEKIAIRGRLQRHQSLLDLETWHKHKKHKARIKPLDLNHALNEKPRMNQRIDLKQPTINERRLEHED